MLYELGVSYSDKCSIKCRHCSADSGPLKNHTLDYKKLIQVIPHLHEIGIRKLLVTGGEPILYLNDLEKLSREVKRWGWGLVQQYTAPANIEKLQQIIEDQRGSSLI